MKDIVADLGADAPVVISVNGDDHSYYHDRQSGDWGSYVVDDVIADAVKRFGVDDDRVAVGGFSMGGFGAYRIAAMHRDRFCAVGGHAPAIWESGGETAPGAFDDNEDFERNDVIELAQTKPDLWKRARLWIDYSNADPFAEGTKTFAAALDGGGNNLVVHEWKGNHSMRYVRSHLRQIMRFYADSLASC